LVLFVAGCLSAMTKRMDTTNAQLAETNQHLASIDEKTREANARMIEMNQHLLTTNEQLMQTNRRLEAIEKRFPRLPLLGAAESPLSPPQKRSDAAE
jgi:septal ring factor EnvC (AmiA/AmiB activator)